MAILESVTPLVEQLSIDEAFLDVGGVRRQHGTGEQVAALLRQRVRAETGLTAVGRVSPRRSSSPSSRAISRSPTGSLVVAPGTELEFLDPLPVTRLWGVGPATFRTLDRMASAHDRRRRAARRSAPRRRARVVARRAPFRTGAQRRRTRGRARPRHEVDRGRGDLRHRPAHRCGMPARARPARRSRRRRVCAPRSTSRARSR